LKRLSHYINQDALILAFTAGICLLFINALHLPQGFWAIITIGAIYQHGTSELTTKAILRLLGTVMGGAIASLIYHFFSHDILQLSLATFFILILTSYLNIQTKPYNYLFVVLNLTLIIVLGSYFLKHLPHAAINRCLEVGLGILVVFVIKVIIAKIQTPHLSILEKDLMQNLCQTLKNIHYSKRNLRQSIIIATTASLTILAWTQPNWHRMVWATVSILLMLEANVEMIREKIYIFLLAEIIAALYGGLIAMYYHQNLSLICLGLMFGFGICGYIISKQKNMLPLGNILACTLSITLLAGYPHDAYQIALNRLSFVYLGILISITVLFIFQKQFD
jgi:uncharacterized membrane protein YccC